MALLARNDFLTKWRGIIGEEKEVDFLEDMADSFPESDTNNQTAPEPAAVDYESDENPYKPFKAKYNEIYGKYVDRFMGGKGAPAPDSNNDTADEGNDKENITLPNGMTIDADIFTVERQR